MGGNNTYNKALGGVTEVDRTHRDVGQRIDGHKILVQKEAPWQVKVPMNSNSEAPIYLCARDLKGKDGKYEIASIAIYENHKIVGQIDLDIDKNGNVKPYSSKGGTHYHKFDENNKGEMGRKSGAKDNHHPVPDKYQALLDKVIEYNKKQRQ